MTVRDEMAWKGKLFSFLLQPAQEMRGPGSYSMIFVTAWQVFAFTAQTVQKTVNSAMQRVNRDAPASPAAYLISPC